NAGSLHRIKQMCGLKSLEPYRTDDGVVAFERCGKSRCVGEIALHSRHASPCHDLFRVAPNSRDRVPSRYRFGDDLRADISARSNYGNLHDASPGLSRRAMLEMSRAFK